MEQIDTSRRKPRRTKGTPSYHYRNRFAFAIIAASTAAFALWHLTPIQRIGNEKLFEKVRYSTEVERDRKAIFDFTAPRTGRAIRETIEEKERLFTER